MPAACDDERIRTWRFWVRVKPDGTLDGLEHWRERDSSKPWRLKAPEGWETELMADILRNHPNLTREEAQEQIDLFG
jgi:hypothetical protein